MEKEESRAYIKHIVLDGTPAERRALYGFNKETSNEKVLKKFQLFSKGNFIRYFQEDDAPFHPEMIVNDIKSYRGQNEIDLGFRGDSKTSLGKLFLVFVLLNDEDHFRKYIKVLSRDIINSTKIVTDSYNMCLELFNIYGDVFQVEGKRKQEETMSSFTMKSGVKLSAGTVGTKQRGHLQDAFRPDWIWFEDIEDKESVSSMTITNKVIELCDEAINGLAFNGSWKLTGNYISDAGSVEWFLGKANILKIITPILSNYKVENGKLIEGIPTWPIYTFDRIKALEKDALDFWGDYMCDPNRSKNKFFNIEKIEEDLKQCTAPKKTSGLVKYWGFYSPHHRYGQGSDHSEGIGEDANTLVGFNFNTGELQYTYANNEIDPGSATHEFARVGAEYGNCVWGPEVNNTCGGTVRATALALNYPRLYEQKTLKQGVEIPNGKFGWETNGKTKNTILFDYKRDYNDGLIKIYDADLLKEMKAYTNSDLKEKTTGLITRHFDLLMAACIAWAMRNEELVNSKSATVVYHDN